MGAVGGAALQVPRLWGPSVDLLALFLAAEFIGEVNSLGLTEGIVNAASVADFLNGDVLHTNGNDALFILKSKVELLLLVDLKDVEVPTRASAGQNSGDEGTLQEKIIVIAVSVLLYYQVVTYVPDGSARVIARSALEEFNWTEESEDWFVLAGGEVDDLVDFVDLVLFPAELVESLGPWHLSLLLFAGRFKRSRVVLL